MSDDFPDLPEYFKQKVDRFVDGIVRDEEEDEKVFKAHHLSYAEDSLKQGFNIENSGRLQHYKPPKLQVPLWLFLLLGTWALAATALLGIVVDSTFPEGSNLPNNGEIVRPSESGGGG